MKITVDKADRAFSLYIQARDKYCQKCGGTTGLQNSHFFGRGKESTRFDPENCDALCFACHVAWGSEDREAYRAFKIKQLGQQRFDALCVRANNYHKKDRAMAYLEAKALMADLKGGENGS